MRLVLIDDNDELRQQLVHRLEMAGFAVDSFSSLARAANALGTRRYAAAILNPLLRDGDGFRLLRSVREQGNPVPVLICSTQARLEDRLAGFAAGADDYLVSPVYFEELIARLRAILRRPTELLGQSLRLGNLLLETEGRQVLIDDVPKLISLRELAILEFLLRHSGRVVPKKDLAFHILGASDGSSSNAIEVYVSRLRKTLIDHGALVAVTTVRGVGYLIGEMK